LTAVEVAAAAEAVFATALETIDVIEGILAEFESDPCIR